MRYYALACDYDGTLATNGLVDQDTLLALEHVRESGRKLLLVTGRELPELIEIFPKLDIFERVVAENGALLYNPHSREERLLTEPPSAEFVNEIKKRKVNRFSVGKAIIAAWKPDETVILEIIRDLGLELQVIFNKDAVMVLPSGVNKATGLKEALQELGLSSHNAIGIGDAENDHAFLSMCEFSTAVSNALPTLKERVDFITKSDHGKGVSELINKIITNDLQEFESRLLRHMLIIGKAEDDKVVTIKPYNESLMLTGTSGGGKSTLATTFLEKLLEKKYQFCIIDPEGDYQDFENAVMIGSSKQEPNIEEVMKILENPFENCVINMLDVKDRPAFFSKLLPELLELRTRTGRPHWIIIDETHHLFPSDWDPAVLTIPRELRNMVFITVHPEHVAQTILSTVDKFIIIGETPGETIKKCSSTLNTIPPAIPTKKLQRGEAFLWDRRNGTDPFWFRGFPPKTQLRRHKLKYTEGELEENRNFYFKGPHGKLNLRAQNLMIFLQISEGVDDETWMFHLKQRDYSNWFRNKIKDEELAKEAERIEELTDITPREGRKLIDEIVRKKYTAPE